MNDRKIKKLFELARNDPPPAAPFGFESRVQAGIRREGREAHVSWWDQIGALFPRLAVAVVLVMGACVGTEYYNSTTHQTSLSGDLSSIAVSEQWQVADNGD